jgi:hypothetical protein
VYGTITMGALLAAESARGESFRRTVEASVLALGLVWAAHAYAAVLGHRLARPGTRTPTDEDSSQPTASRAAPNGPGATEDHPKPGPVNELAGQPPLSAAELGRLLGHEFAVLKGGVAPLLALFLSWAAGASLATAITATLWTCAGTLIAAELIAGLRTSAGAPTIALHMATGASLGAGLLALRAILH